MNGDAVTSVRLNSAGAAANVLVGSGSYPITLSDVNVSGFANYAITLVNGTLTVVQRPLTITANDASKTEGQALTFAGTEFKVSGPLPSATMTP